MAGPAWGSLVLACSLLCGFYLTSASDLRGQPSPLLVWSSKNALAHGSGPRVSYEVVPNAAELAGTVVAAAVGKEASGAEHVMASSQQETPSAVVFIGSQLHTADLRRASGLDKLSALLERSESSVAFPYTSTQAACLHDAIEKQLNNAHIQFKAVSCKEASEDLAGALSTAIEAAGPNGTPVLIVSSHVDKSLDGTEAGLQAELDQLLLVQEVLEASELDAVMVYASHPTPAMERRTLQEDSSAKGKYTGFGQYQECGQLCRVQVRWLEGMLALLILALAAASGMTCLYMLDTPTRFESVKEGANQQ